MPHIVAVRPPMPRYKGPMKLFYSLFFGLMLTTAAHAADDPEVRRLAQSMDKLAQKNAWDGVERAYEQIEGLGGTSNRATVSLGAEAARNRGDVSAHLARLKTAQDLSGEPDTASAIASVRGEFGSLAIVCRASDCPAVVPVVEPFRPDLKNAIAFANAGLTDKGKFEGYLPVGSYAFGHQNFEVFANVEALRIEHSRVARVRGLLDEIGLPRTAEISKKVRLDLNGAGAWNRDGKMIAVTALYLGAPDAMADHVIADTSPKRLLVHWLVPQSAGELFDEFQARFGAVQGMDDVLEDEVFLIMLEAVAPGDRLIFDWVPGKKEGGLVRFWVNDHERGTIKEAQFMTLLWTVFLGPHTDEEMRKGLLGAVMPTEPVPE